MATIGQQLKDLETGWKRYDDSDKKITYIGTWYDDNNSAFYKGSQRYSTDKTSKITLSFYGTKFRIIASTCAYNSSIIQIVIDDNIIETFSEYNSTEIKQALVYEKTSLENKQHTITINNTQSSYIRVDAIDIDDTGYLISQVGQQLTAPEPGWRRYDDTDSRILYDKNWVTGSANSNYYGNKVSYTTTYLSKCSFKFYGTKLRLIDAFGTTRDSNIIVTIDDQQYNYSGYSVNATYQCIVFEKSDLSLGMHTVTITKGTNDSSYIMVDAIDIDDTGDLLGTGIQLTTPEAGWRRYDDTDSRIKYNGTGWTSAPISGDFGGTHTGSNVADDNFTFKFYGTKLRVINPENISWSDCAEITIDGVTSIFSMYAPSITLNVLSFEKVELPLGVHSVEVKTTIAGKGIGLDAIDIDDTGYLVHPTLNQVSNLLVMSVGDCIPCRYTAASGKAGVFSELGTCTADEIPVAGTATPDGLFYFVKTAKGTLVADRVIQTNISWDVLNNNGLIEGLSSCVRSIPILTGSVPELTESAVLSSGYDGWMCLDNLIGSSSRWSPTIYPEWLAYDYKRSVKIISYKVGYWYNSEPSQASPKNFGLYGWDGTQWVQVDYQSNITWTVGGAGAYYKTFNVANPSSYTKYKFQIDADNGYGRCSIALLEFYEAPFNLIRSLSGGCAYADANENKSTTDCSKGGWPVTNEWDKYIVNSDLGGKIVPADDNIWHKSSLYSWVKETIINGTFTSNTGTTASGINTGRACRAKMVGIPWNDWSFALFSNVVAYIGFRPVLEFIESDSKQTTLWY